MSLDRVTAWIAVAGSLIAAGQAGSTWINGVYSERAAIARAEQELEIEQEKGKQELALERVKGASELAQSYLATLLGQDRRSGERILLLDALRQIPDHPLQRWASDRYDREVLFEKEMQRLAEEKAAAQTSKSELSNELATLDVELEELRLRINATEIPAEREELLATLTTKILRQGQVKGDLTVQQIQATAIATAQTAAANTTVLLDTAVAQTTANTSCDGRKTTILVDTAATQTGIDISTTAETVTPDLLRKIFADTPAIDANYVYLQNALKEFAISDPRLAAAILATLAIETPAFSSYTESEAAGQRYEGKTGLGNTKPGDGVTFRGRGYIGLTGRANYEAMSKRLGLGQVLVENPDEAARPEIASRIAIAYMADRRQRILRDLDEQDFAGIRKAVVGSTLKADLLKQKYERILPALSISQK